MKGTVRIDIAQTPATSSRVNAPNLGLPVTYIDQFVAGCVRRYYNHGMVKEKIYECVPHEMHWI